MQKKKKKDAISSEFYIKISDLVQIKIYKIILTMIIVKITDVDVNVHFVIK